LLLPFATTFLGFAFVFGNSLKNLFEAFLFIFVTKAFEVGDRVTIPGTSPPYPTLIVAQLDFLKTIFYAPDGRMFIIPNSILANVTIIQYKRSRDYAINKTLEFGIDTSRKQLDQFMTQVNLWCKQHATYPFKKPFIAIDSVDTLTKIKVGVWIEMRDISWQMSGIYLQAEHDLLIKCFEICAELKIICYNAPVHPYTGPFVSTTSPPTPVTVVMKEEDEKILSKDLNKRKDNSKDSSKEDGDDSTKKKEDQTTDSKKSK